MTEKRPLRLPSAKLIAIAALAGIMAGAVAVYVKEAGIGKVAEAGQCEASMAKAEALKPFAKGQVAALVAPNGPRKVEGLSFAGADGRNGTLADFAGKTVLVNLWATWCVPCREEMPALDALQKEKGSDKFEVVAINIDTGSADKPKDFLTEIGVQNLGLYLDPSMASFNSAKKQGLAFGLPATLLIDEKGCLLGAMNGPAAWDSPDALALIDAAKGS